MWVTSSIRSARSRARSSRSAGRCSAPWTRSRRGSKRSSERRRKDRWIATTVAQPARRDIEQRQGMTTVHQLTPHFVPGDAISGHTLRLRDALRAEGFESDIYAEIVHPRYNREARPFTDAV